MISNHSFSNTQKNEYNYLAQNAFKRYGARCPVDELEILFAQLERLGCQIRDIPTYKAFRIQRMAVDEVQQTASETCHARQQRGARELSHSHESVSLGDLPARLARFVLAPG
jgi:hypothetical protein